jgi:hypothetical protein
MTSSLPRTRFKKPRKTLSRVTTSTPLSIVAGSAPPITKRRRSKRTTINGATALPAQLTATTIRLTPDDRSAGLLNGNPLLVSADMRRLLHLMEMFRCPKFQTITVTGAVEDKPTAGDCEDRGTGVLIPGVTLVWPVYLPVRKIFLLYCMDDGVLFRDVRWGGERGVSSWIWTHLLGGFFWVMNISFVVCIFWQSNDVMSFTLFPLFFWGYSARLCSS